MKQMFKVSMLGLFAIGLMIASCSKETLSTSNGVFDFVDESLYTLQESGNIGNYGCYELVFPVSVEFPDATTVEVNDYDELRAEVQAWKEANPDIEGRPSFVFPIEVISEEGEVITVNDSDELRALKIECGGGKFGKHGKKGHRFKCKPCFNLVFPVSIEYPDGTTAEAADRKELKTLIREWKQANPGSDERPTLVFPIDVVMEDGSIVTVNSIEELKELRESCSDE